MEAILFISLIMAEHSNRLWMGYGKVMEYDTS